MLETYAILTIMILTCKRVYDLSPTTKNHFYAWTYASLWWSVGLQLVSAPPRLWLLGPDRNWHGLGIQGVGWSWL